MKSAFHGVFKKNWKLKVKTSDKEMTKWSNTITDSVRGTVAGAFWERWVRKMRWERPTALTGWILTTVRDVWTKLDDDGVFAALASVVSERGAEAGRPALTGVWATLLVEGGGAQVLMAGWENLPVQEVTHVRGVGRWGEKETGGEGQHLFKSRLTGTVRPWIWFYLKVSFWHCG